MAFELAWADRSRRTPVGAGEGRSGWSVHGHLLAAHALVAAADRSIRTPTSGVWPSTAQHVEHAEEDVLPGIPGQQPIDELASAAHDLAGQTDERVDEGFELHG